ncbi:hypothetical protein Pst134EA_029497 [Puccinia striiformis f. sp. tritici]|uniref:hypothetical protein n=1 Tax=Puccinia striiformis f. sp. tritici TaxID=168172 RepID=UPI0020083579|nr:hypothetical protein Pst134EA_029497 [Puccinia striiformis f. sp. tritici]KAH9447461.1 hypothetical protein Pst134EA_029497 [Puccinia striiformis f. sp. tritici]
MVLFGTRKSSLSPNAHNDTHEPVDDNPFRKSAVVTPEPHSSASINRVLSPIQPHGLEQYSFRPDFIPANPQQHLRPPSTHSHQSSRPHCTTSPPRSLTNISIQSSPQRPQSPRIRSISLMASQDQPMAQSSAESPAAFTFNRLFKSKIFSSTSKIKPTAQPGLAPPNASENPYLLPSMASSSDFLNNPSQAAYHEQNQPKFNTFSHAQRSNFVNLPQPIKEPIDWAQLDPSALPMTSRRSVESSRPTSIYGGYATSPVNRVVIDANASRRNFPQFNNKPAMQAGPKVTRINPQIENHQHLNPLPAGNVLSIESSFHAHSPRPTPIPHGGSGAVLSISTLNPTRPAALTQPSQQDDTLPLGTTPAAKVAASFESIPTTLIIEKSSIATPSPSSPPAASLKISSENPTYRDGPTTDLYQVGCYYRPAEPLTEHEIIASPVASSSVAAIPEPLATEPQLGASRSPAPAGSLDLGDFSYLYRNSVVFTSRADTTDSNCPDSPPADLRASIRRVPPPLTLASSTASSIRSFASTHLKSPMLPQDTLSALDSRPSSTSTLSVRSDKCSPPPPSKYSPPLPLKSSPPLSSNFSSSLHSQCLPTLPTLRSGRSPSPLARTPVQLEKLVLSTAPLLVTNPASSPSAPHSLPSTVAPTLPISHPSTPTVNVHPTLSNLVSPSKKPLLLDNHSEPPEPTPISVQSQIELDQARQMILGLQNQVKQLKDASLSSSGTTPPPTPLVIEKLPDASAAEILPVSIITRPSVAHVPRRSSSTSTLSGPTTCTSQTWKSEDKTQSSSHSENLNIEETHEQGVGLSEKTLADTIAEADGSSSPVTRGKDLQQEVFSQHPFRSQSEPPTDSLSDDPDEPAEHSAPQLLPSRLPVAQHRLRGMVSMEFRGSSEFMGTSTAPISRGQTKASISLASSVSTDYRYDTPESYSTQMTTPSPISTTHRSHRVPSGKQTTLPNQMRADTDLSSPSEGWSREVQSFNHNHYSEKPALPSRMAGRGAPQETRWQPTRSLNDSSISAAAPRPSSSASLAMNRPDPSTSRAHRQHQPSPSISLQSIPDEDSVGSGSELGSAFERMSHGSSHQASRSGLDSVNEDSALNPASGKFNKFSLRLMTKPELLSIIKKQRAQLENVRAEFAAERDDLIDTLEQTREKEAEMSRERERLLAEDAWKSDELSRAREEIGWLSRLADTLELEKSRLETRANSMANELKRAVVDLRTVSTASSQGIGSSRDMRAQPVSSHHSYTLGRLQGTDDFTGNKFESGPPNRAARKYSHSPITTGRPSPPRRNRQDSVASAPRRTRQDSVASQPRRVRQDSLASAPRRVRQDSVASGPRRDRHDSAASGSTVCLTSPKLQSTKSYSNMKNPTTSRRTRESQITEPMPTTTRNREFNIPPGKSLVKRSTPDFRSPLASLKMPSQRPARHEQMSSRQATSRRPNDTRSISSHQSQTEYHEEEEEEQASSEEGFRGDDNMEEEEEDEVSRDGSWSQDDTYRRHSRNSSSSSQVISPSSTVFADHHRDEDSSTATRSSGPRDRHNYQHRSSLMSLQLRPEDELFLEDYLEEDGDDIDTDMDY